MATVEVTVTARSTVKFSCGCGFVAREIMAALDHVLVRQHVVQASGIIGPAERISAIDSTPA